MMYPAYANDNEVKRSAFPHAHISISICIKALAGIIFFHEARGYNPANTCGA